MPMHNGFEILCRCASRVDTKGGLNGDEYFERIRASIVAVVKPVVMIQSREISRAHFSILLPPSNFLQTLLLRGKIPIVYFNQLN